MFIQHKEAVINDIGRIKTHIIDMARLAESSLRDALKAILNSDHTLAYGVILRDQYIDEKEKEIDRLCLEFMVKQQPVSGSLRFAFSAVKLNVEIERVGDYAESMARNIYKMEEWPDESCKNCIVQLAELSISMFHDAIQAFIAQSEDTARKTLVLEDNVDRLRDDCINRLLSATRNRTAPMPMLNIVRRFERVADQARNICMEVLYMCTGEYMKHPGSEVIRILFVDEHNSLRSQIAEAVGNGLNLNRFHFSSAGLDPGPVEPATVLFMKNKGFDLSRTVSTALAKVPHLEFYQVVVAFSPEVKKLFPHEPCKTIYLDWAIEAPVLSSGNPAGIEAEYEKVFGFVTENVNNLVNAITGTTVDRGQYNSSAALSGQKFS